MSEVTTVDSSEQSDSKCERSKHGFSTQLLSRRKVLKGAAATAGAVAIASTAGSDVATASVVGTGACEIGTDGQEIDTSLNGGAVSPGNFDRPGHPNRDAYRSLAETERRFGDVLAQNGDNGQGRPKPKFQRTVNAVDDLGADPNGNEPANNAIEQGAEEGTLIILPKGSEFLLDGDLNLSVDGTFGMVGEGFEKASKPPGKGGARFVAAPGTQVRIITGEVTSGLLANFIMDQSASDAGIALLLQATGFCFGRDIRITGIQDSTGTEADEENNHPACAMIAHAESAVVRLQRFYVSNTGLPGDKNKGGVPGVWVGKTNKGLAEIVQCQISNSADNGIYASRTPGYVHIIDGAYINNEVSQFRIAGKGSWANGSTILIDVEQYKGPNPSDFNNKIATNGVKTEMPSFINKPGGAALKNVEAIGQSAKNIGSLVFVRGHAGALTMENCKVVNVLDDVPSLIASVPGSSYDPKSPPPYDITLNKCTFTGTLSSPVITIQGRPASTISDTCIKIKGAGPENIQGQVSLQNVTYGPECNGTGSSGAVGSAIDAAKGAYNAVVGFVTGVVSGLFKGAAVIAALPIIVLIAIAILAFIFSSSLLAALAFGGGAIKFFSKNDK
jgi:hypothetical protein